ncbi:hypothetical protein FOL47_001640 [Perkinsus chesapeaki]|uniref:Sodium/calcium exchanger membrane region domain-containing protein n=1 Tax=Perkinsus chesapeaki TaxID=330153 RepID=A0A7J6N0K5_PERCH|nr:hypothetical protein FOL47_001640 [Perkinsus chesapeaki]
MRAQCVVSDKYLITSCRATTKRLHSGWLAPIGAFLMSAASVSPELCTSVSSILLHRPTLGLGCVIGCNIFTLSAVLAAGIFSSEGTLPKLNSAAFTGTVLTYTVALVIILIAQRGGYSSAGWWWLLLTIGACVCVISACRSPPKPFAIRGGKEAHMLYDHHLSLELSSPLLCRETHTWPVEIKVFLGNRLYDIYDVESKRRLMQAGTHGLEFSPLKQRNVRNANSLLELGSPELHFDKDRDVQPSSLLLGSPVYDTDLPLAHHHLQRQQLLRQDEASDQQPSPEILISHAEQSHSLVAGRWKISYNRIVYVQDIRGPLHRLVLYVSTDLGDEIAVDLRTISEDAKSAVLSKISAQGIRVEGDGLSIRETASSYWSVNCSSRVGQDEVDGDSNNSMLLWFRRVRFAITCTLDVPLYPILAVWIPSHHTVGLCRTSFVMLLAFALVMIFSLVASKALVAIADCSEVPLSLMSLSVYSIGLNAGNLWCTSTTLRYRRSLQGIMDVLDYGIRNLYLALSLPLALFGGVTISARIRGSILWLTATLLVVVVFARIEALKFTRLTACSLVALYFLYCFYLMNSLSV